jgi:hypothetical protein
MEVQLKETPTNATLSKVLKRRSIKKNASKFIKILFIQQFTVQGNFTIDG